MIALIAVVTLILLARAFRSVVLPIKAVILNALSTGAAWGALTLVWQKGYGSHALWGIDASGAIPAWMPLMIFAFLFGLSMDYEVFILSRIREEYDNSGSTRAAVIGGIGRTGRLVTSAALILFLAFVSMASGPNVDLKMFATGLAAGILHRCDGHPRAARPGRGRAARTLELVAAPSDRPGPARASQPAGDCKRPNELMSAATHRADTRQDGHARRSAHGAPKRHADCSRNAHPHADRRHACTCQSG